MLFFMMNNMKYLLVGLLVLVLPIVSSCKDRESEKSIIMNMPYHEARKVILQSGWKPVLGNTSDENIGVPALAFRDLGYIEVDDCSGTGIGYCSFYFQNEKGQYLRIGTEGDDNGPNTNRQALVIYAAVQNSMD